MLGVRHCTGKAARLWSFRGERGNCAMIFSPAGNVATFAEAVPPQPPVTAMKFTGVNADFRQLVTKGAALEFVTLGFYRFWLATRIRQHLWSNTEIDGDPLEYLGTARELLIGFLVAIAILAPAYFLYFLAGLAAESYQTLASLPLAMLYYGFLQFAIYRGRRYRLNRTMWRGVRFGMDGSGVAYAAKAMGWSLATFLTLGLLYPWRQAALERAKMQHTFYGGLRGDFAGTGGALFRSLWWLYALAIGAVAGVAALGYLASQKKVPDGAVVLLILCLAISLPFAFASLRASEWKWWIEGMRLGPASAASRLGRGDLAGYYWAMLGLFFVAALFFASLLALLAALGYASGIRFPDKGSAPTLVVLAPMALLYLGFLLTGTAIVRIYAIQRIWKAVVTSTIIVGLDRMGEVFARNDDVSAIGEGLVDGFDVLGF